MDRPFFCKFISAFLSLLLWTSYNLLVLHLLSSEIKSLICIHFICVENHDFIFQKITLSPLTSRSPPIPPIHPQTWQFNFINVSCVYPLLSILLAATSLPELSIPGLYLALFRFILGSAARFHYNTNCVISTPCLISSKDFPLIFFF